MYYDIIYIYIYIYTSVDPFIYMHGFICFEEIGIGIRWSAESFCISFLNSVFRFLLLNTELLGLRSGGTLRRLGASLGAEAWGVSDAHATTSRTEKHRSNR